jgi:hypothetical protein
MYNHADFIREIQRDNNRFGRIPLQARSLDMLVSLLGNRRLPSAGVLSLAIIDISQEKWRRYEHAKRYLLANIPGLLLLVRHHFGTPVSFRTVSIQNGSTPGNIVHEVSWSSSTGNLEDLGHIRTRECVRWSDAAPNAQQYLNADYHHAGVHHGVGTAWATAGRNRDEHDCIGPFGTNASLEYTGTVPLTMVMDQEYEYEEGDGIWRSFPRSGFQITRTLTFNPTTDTRTFAITKAATTAAGGTRHTNQRQV